MLDIAEELNRWVEQGRDFAVATVVAVGGSAPRQPGAALAVDAEGTAIGSVSGGCVEGAVYELCQQALEDGETVLERFGYSDEDAFAVGLTCGGIIDILVTPVRGRGDPVRPVVAAALSAAGAAGRRRRWRGSSSGPAELRGPRPAGPPRRLLRRRLRRPPRTGPHGRAARGRRPPRRRPHRHAWRSASRASRCGAPLTVLVESSRPAAPDDRLRCDRLRVGAGPGRQVPRLPRHGLRRPPRLRDQDPLPGGGRDRRRVAAPVSGAHRTSTPGRSCASSPTTPSSTSHCSSWPCGSPSPTSARWAPAAPTWTATSACAKSA